MRRLYPIASAMGYVTAGCDVQVQRLDGTSTAPGEIGEIVVGGEPGVTLFAGYLDDPETTAASFRDSWFLTGDRAWRDEAGRFFFDGRRSDVLKVSGENVSTVEVEQVLAEHPGVLEAAVVGMPDDVRDEVPVGFVVPADPADPPAVDELHQWCEERLTRSKRPREITLVDELPRHERRQDPQVPAPRQGGVPMTVLTDDLLAVRRVHHGRVHRRDDAARDLHVRGVLRFRAHGRLRPRVAVRRA